MKLKYDHKTIVKVLTDHDGEIITLGLIMNMVGEMEGFNWGCDLNGLLPA